MPPKTENKHFSGKKRLTVDQKVEVLTYFKETNCSVRKLAKIFNIGKTQAGQIVKQEECLLKLSQFEGSYYTGRKLRPGSAGFEVDRIVYAWYTEQKNENMLVTGPMIQSKALETADEIGHRDFKASNGWLSKFLKRHTISFHPETQSDKVELRKDDEDLSIFQGCKDKFFELISTYAAEDIYSLVQTGLFYKSIPNDAWKLSGDTCSSGKLLGSRFTLLFCVSMAGVKEKPLVIANISESEIKKLNNSEVDCVSDEKAWITQDITTKWLKEMDCEIGKKKRKIILFLSHAIPGSDCRLKNIQIMNLPPFLSSENKSFNQRIIQDFKIIYRQQLLKYLIELKSYDENETLPEQSISESQAISWISTAWKGLGEYVIQKNFQDFGLNCSVEDASESADDPSASLNEVSNLLCAFDSDVSAVDYVSIDNCLVTWENSESVEILMNEDYMQHTFLDFEKRMEAEPKQELIISSYPEALQNLRKLEQFYSAKNDQTCGFIVSQLIANNKNSI